MRVSSTELHRPGDRAALFQISNRISSIMAIPSDAARSLMIEQQLRQRGITSPEVLEAIARVPRERFVCEEMADRAYWDQPSSNPAGAKRLV